MDQKANTSKSPDLSRSVCFWVVLFAALGLYGLAVLSPKFAEREQLFSKYTAHQTQLSHDERKLARLQQVAASLQQNSRFVDELLQSELKSRPQADQEIIPLEGNLVYRENQPRDDAASSQTTWNPPWYAPVLTVIGNSSDIRGVLLLAAVVLILIAFGFLQLPASSAESSGVRATAEELPRQPNLLKKWLSRYDGSKDEAERQKLLERLARLEADADWEKDALPMVSIDEDEA